ncbi:MAG: hypothetical protein R2770_21875 [Acidimicrobiales bacterium]
MLDEMPASTPMMFEAATDDLSRPMVVRGEPSWTVLFDAEIDRFANPACTSTDDGDDSEVLVRASRHRTLNLSIHQVASASSAAVFAPGDLRKVTNRSRLPTATIDRLASDTSSHEDLASSVRVHLSLEPHNATLHPGDTLFVPAGWWVLHAYDPASWAVRAAWSTQGSSRRLLSLLRMTRP